MSLKCRRRGTVDGTPGPRLRLVFEPGDDADDDPNPPNEVGEEMFGRAEMPGEGGTGLSPVLMEEMMLPRSSVHAVGNAG